MHRRALQPATHGKGMSREGSDGVLPSTQHSTAQHSTTQGESGRASEGGSRGKARKCAQKDQDTRGMEEHPKASNYFPDAALSSVRQPQQGSV